MKHARTIRFRLTVLYGLVFLITGAILLTIGYALVRHNLSARPNIRAALQKLGINPPVENPLFGRRLIGAGGPPDFRVIETVRAQLRSDALHRLVIEYIAALGVMTMVSVAAGWLLAGRALRPLRDITATARRVSGENLGERIALVGPADELKELADTFDGMLARLDSAFGSQRHFVANASHELRTPLAIMRTEIDVALADPDASTAELRAMGEAVRDTVDRYERLIESLLLLARSESALRRRRAGRPRRAGGRLRHRSAGTGAGGPRRDHGRPRACGRPRRSGAARADDRQPARQRDPAQRAGRVDRGTHALRPSRRSTLASATAVRGSIRPSPGRCAEPFRRVDRTAGGFGLGLSIVRSVAEAHGGHAELSAPADGGLEVHVSLPARLGSGGAL